MKTKKSNNQEQIDVILSVVKKWKTKWVDKGGWSEPFNINTFLSSDRQQYNVRECRLHNEIVKKLTDKVMNGQLTYKNHRNKRPVVERKKIERYMGQQAVYHYKHAKSLNGRTYVTSRKNAAESPLPARRESHLIIKDMQKLLNASENIKSIDSRVTITTFFGELFDSLINDENATKTNKVKKAVSLAGAYTEMISCIETRELSGVKKYFELIKKTAISGR